MKKAEEEATLKAVEEKQGVVSIVRESGESLLVTKGELPSVLHDLMKMNMVGPKTGVGSSKLKQELMSNEVKLGVGIT